MFGWLKTVRWGLGKVGKIAHVIEEGKDVYEAVDLIQSKYKDLDDDVAAAWVQVKEFIDAVKDAAK